ncbi:MAG: hypothetical protein U5K84_09945 [Alkalibacterium sp.]|nr:hypothetical protein [Alkalibacterium sp.]
MGRSDRTDERVSARISSTTRGELLKITQRLISNFENQVNFSSHALVANRALSQVKPAAKLNELLNGIDQFNYLKGIRDELKSDSVELNLKLTQMLARLLTNDRLNILYTGGADRKMQVKDVLTTAFASLPSQPIGEAVTYKPGPKQNEAYVTAQDVNYVGLGSDAMQTRRTTPDRHKSCRQPSASITCGTTSE